MTPPQSSQNTTPLRAKMLADALHRLAPSTQKLYATAITAFTCYWRSPDQPRLMRFAPICTTGRGAQASLAYLQRDRRRHPILVCRNT